MKVLNKVKQGYSAINEGGKGNYEHSMFIIKKIAHSQIQQLYIEPRNGVESIIDPRIPEVPCSLFLFFVCVVPCSLFLFFVCVDSILVLVSRGKAW